MGRRLCFPLREVCVRMQAIFKQSIRFILRISQQIPQPVPVEYVPAVQSVQFKAPADTQGCESRINRHQSFR